MPVGESYYDVLTQAVNDFAEHGFDSQERLDYWVRRLRAAAIGSLPTLEITDRALREQLVAIYRRLIDNAGILRKHPGVARFTLEQVKPKLRAELDRRIMASAQLIRLNRDEAIEKTIRRFSGWTTSIPAGGSRVVDRVETKTDIRKSLARLSFEERRVVIDQGHRFVSELSNILAVDSGAIAAIWHHHYVTYPRKEHLAREGKIFLIRNSWAHERGLVRPGENGYTDQIEAPGSLVLCRCDYQYVYGLGALPVELLTRKGEAELEKARAA